MNEEQPQKWVGNISCLKHKTELSFSLIKHKINKTTTAKRSELKTSTDTEGKVNGFIFLFEGTTCTANSAASRPI